MTPRDLDRAADIVTVAVIASVAVALAGLTWRVAALLAPAAPLAIVAPLPHADVDVAPILALAPFGAGGGGAPVPTTLPLELRGVLRATPASASVALIAPIGGAPLPYRIGQSVPGGGAIEAIANDSVVFAGAGGRQRLGFPLPGAPAQAVAGSAPAAPPASVPPAAPNSNSPQALLDSMGAQAINSGYRVGAALAPDLRQAGLQPGDVVEQVNGAKLGNPATDSQLLAAAIRSGTIRLDVMRGDRHLTLAVPTR